MLEGLAERLSPDGQGASVAKNGRGVQLLRRTRHTAAAPTHAAPHICWGKMLRGISGLSTGVSSGHGFQGGQPPVLRGCCSPPLGVEGQSGPSLTTAWGSKHSPWGFSLLSAGKCTCCKREEWWDNAQTGVGGSEREEQSFDSLIYWVGVIYNNTHSTVMELRLSWGWRVWVAVRGKSCHLTGWFIEQGLFTAISTARWWRCGFRGGDVPEPSSNSQGVPVSQVLSFLSCQVDWTPGVFGVFFPSSSLLTGRGIPLQLSGSKSQENKK